MRELIDIGIAPAIELTREAVELTKKSIRKSRIEINDYSKSIDYTRAAITSSYDAMQRINEAIELASIIKTTRR